MITVVLCIGQDNLFAHLPECAVDHFSTGRSITPMARRVSVRKVGLLTILGRIARGDYDLIVLPAVDLTNDYDESSLKRLLRRLVAAGLRFRVISRPLDRLLSRRNTMLIMLDRYDSSTPLTGFLDCVPSTSLYFKTNLLSSDERRIHKSPEGRACRFKHLPYWIESDRYAGVRSNNEEKDTDIFFAGKVNSRARRASLDWLRAMEKLGYRIKIYEGRPLDFDEYLQLMSRSWLTLSPEGCGYNGFRHYEAMLVGSIPLINRPEEDILNDFADGENCFLYSLQKGDLAEVAQNALRDKDKLRQIAEAMRQWALEKHSPTSVGRYLIQTATAAREEVRTQIVGSHEEPLLAAKPSGQDDGETVFSP